MSRYQPGIDAVCEGRADAMGEAQGSALRDRIMAACDVLKQLEAFRLLQPKWMPYFVYRWLAERKSRRFLAQALERDSGSFERLQGLATGAGLPFRTICLFNALEPMLSSIAGCTACPGACSSVALTGRRTTSGGPIVAHNFDYLPLVQPLYMLRRCRPAGKLQSLEFTTAPLAGAVDGINEAGLAIAYDYAFTIDRPSAPSPPISLAIAHALASCRTVEEAATLISRCPRWGGGLLMLADAEGAIASLELSSTCSELRYPESGSDSLFHTNAFFGDMMREVQITGGAVYDERAPVPLRGRRVHESSERRDARFRQLLAESGTLDADGLAALMSDHGVSGTADDDSPCVHGSYWATTACLQFMPRERRMRVAYESACAASYSEFTV
ncbi:MAG: hypothetical protein KDA96_03975 [Planctomycetaceae bacterium]|nr:hypothetical protein [Planctomycetaceae bacterium]